jgi:hypothetical protein
MLLACRDVGLEDQFAPAGLWTQRRESAARLSIGQACRTLQLIPARSYLFAEMCFGRAQDP